MTVGIFYHSHPTLSSRLVLDSQDAQHVVLSYSTSKLNLYANPFRIDILTDGEPVISVNARNLFNFEHTRERK